MQFTRKTDLLVFQPLHLLTIGYITVQEKCIGFKQAYNDEVSWLHQWQVRSSERPWWPAACAELFLRLIYGQFV